MSEQNEVPEQVSSPDPGDAPEAPRRSAEAAAPGSGSGRGARRSAIVAGGILLALLVLATGSLAYRVRQLDDDVQDLEAHLRTARAHEDGARHGGGPIRNDDRRGGHGRFGGSGPEPMQPGHGSPPGPPGQPWGGPPDAYPGPDDRFDDDADQDEGPESEGEHEDDVPDRWNPGDEGDEGGG